DTAYWDDPIRCIEYKSASVVVEIDLTWPFRFVAVELASVVARISLIKLEFFSCLFADSLMNLLRYYAISWMAFLPSSAVLVGTAPLESRICRVGTSNPM
ncbi:hypothetical protein Tco_1129721, partial [Tanacetum coccineum]